MSVVYGEKGYRVDPETKALIFPPRPDQSLKIDQILTLLESVDKKLTLLLGGNQIGS